MSQSVIWQMAVRNFIIYSRAERSFSSALLGRVYIPGRCICKCQFPRLKWPNGTGWRVVSPQPEMEMVMEVQMGLETPFLVNCDDGGIREIANFRTYCDGEFLLLLRLRLQIPAPPPNCSSISISVSVFHL